MSAKARADIAAKLLHEHDYDCACAAYTALVGREPRNPEFRIGLASCLYRLGRHPAAAFHAEAALPLSAGNESYTKDACNLLAKAGDPNKAIKHLVAACEAHADWALARAVLGLLYEGDDRPEDAERVLRESLAIDPHEVWAHLGLANLHANMGRADEALAEFDAIIERFPPEQGVLEAAAFVSNSAPSATPAQVFRYHASLGRFFALNASDLGFEHPPTDDPDRALRVGLVTHDLNNHAASFFFEKILRYVPRAGLRVVVYATGGGRDGATTMLGSLADEAVHLPNISSVNLARRVFADKVDILIDLNGWTSGNRLHAFQTRPAPVQMTYLGYPNTTGLPCMDYRIVDSITDPPGAERFASERLIRLDPCFLCYAPVTQRPLVLPEGWTPPARSQDPGRPITFGSFNNLTKITDVALRAWAEVLNAVPGSRLRVKGRGLNQSGARSAFEQRLAACGVPPGRWEVMAQHKDTSGHLAAYSEIDIALDTFPYNGTTTTCETLLLGVPVVTVRGDRHVARVGASLLTNIGEPALIAEDVAGYVKIAVALAMDRPRLAAMHATLADRFLASPICDGPAFADRFVAALRQAWRRRCESGVGRMP